MNILTKISIVVLVVLVLFTSVVFVTAASVMANYRDLYDQYKNRSDINMMLVNSKELALQKVNSENAALAQKLREAEQQIATERQSASGEQLKSNTEIEQLKRRTSDQAAALTGLENDVKLNTQRNDALLTQLADTRKANDKLLEENRKLTEQNQQLSAASDRLTAQLTSAQESAAEAARRASQAVTAKTEAPAGAAAVGAAPATEQPAEGQAQFIGTITALGKDDTAGINIGSTQGVRKGDRLIVYRSGSFLGYLQVERVQPSDAAGVLVNKQGEIRTGDKVTNYLQ